MTEEQFLRTMMELVKYDDDYDNKEELLTILGRSFIKFDKTAAFTHKHYQCKEYIDLRVPIPLINEAKRLYNDLNKIAAVVYIESDEYAFEKLTICPRPIELEQEENIEHNAVFDAISDTIIQGIRDARYTIWVAVAWFTDRQIFNELMLRKQDGVSIRIILSDEEGNSSLINELETNFEVTKVPMRGAQGRNRFHDKFCIIDLEYVMHGSYNWSHNARNNDETLATALDRNFVRSFADEFINIFKENN